MTHYERGLEHFRAGMPPEKHDEAEAAYRKSMNGATAQYTDAVEDFGRAIVAAFRPLLKRLHLL